MPYDPYKYDPQNIMMPNSGMADYTKRQAQKYGNDKWNNWLLDPNAPWNQLGREADMQKWLEARKAGLQGDLTRATEQAGQSAWGQAFRSGTQNTSLPNQQFTRDVAGINRGYADQLANLEASGYQQLQSERQRRAMMMMDAQLAKMGMDAQQRAALLQGFGQLLGAGAQVATAALLKP